MRHLVDQVRAIVADCCTQLFLDYGVRLVPATGTPAANLTFCASIGLTGAQIRGSILLASSQGPLALAGDDPKIVRDWIGELTNQMVGRVKNRLIALGTTIYYSTPVILRGERLAPLVHQPQSLLFQADGGVVSVWVDIELEPDLVLVESTGVPMAREGDALLF